ANALDEGGTGDPQLEGVGFVTVDAGDRVFDERPGFVERLATHEVPPLHQVALAELHGGHVDRRVTVETGARLPDRLALRVGLVVKHVRMTAVLPEITGEGVPVPHGLQSRILFKA